jgi:metal-responsive CopG/Arc/MetJ family transcriptional regulator
MTKQFTVTFPDYVAEEVIRKQPSSNRSEWFQELVVKGLQTRLIEF